MEGAVQATTARSMVENKKIRNVLVSLNPMSLAIGKNDIKLRMRPRKAPDAPDKKETTFIGSIAGKDQWWEQTQITFSVAVCV